MRPVLFGMSETSQFLPAIATLLSGFARLYPARSFTLSETITMNKFTVALAWPIALITSSSVAAAETNAVNTLTLNGYTGALNVPSAYTVTHGNGIIQYSDAFISGDH